MKLTQEEIQALKDSIEHWNRDIISKFEGGDEIAITRNKWILSNEEVMCYSGDCPLCVLVGNDCLVCPYLLGYVS